MLENNLFFWKTMVFFKSNVFDTTSHMIYFRGIHLICTVIHNCSWCFSVYQHQEQLHRA